MFAILLLGLLSAVPTYQEEVPHPWPGDDVDKLGVVQLGPIHAIIPRTSDGRVNVTVELSVWLRRSGANGADRPYGMPHQDKLIEASYPKHKTAVCLPPVDSVCSMLAPTPRNTDATPALWAAIGPVRHNDSTRDWYLHHMQIAARVTHYVTYHVAMGVSGLLLYADVLTRHYLRQHPRVSRLIRTSQLRLVNWDLPERSHDELDGRGRILGYNYDQALFTGHAMLGLSACGANLMLMLTDLDEYLYSPQVGYRWPAPIGSCMSACDPISMHTLSRIEVLSTKYTPEQEPGLWAPVALPREDVLGTSNPAESAPNIYLPATRLELHPLSQYDMIFRQPMKPDHNKPIVVPAAEVVSFYVHEGAPLHGSRRPVDAECLVLLHVPNYFRPRTDTGHYAQLNRSDFRSFRHWLLASASERAAPLRGFGGGGGGAGASLAEWAARHGGLKVLLIGVGLAMLAGAAVLRLLRGARDRELLSPPRKGRRQSWVE
ncbi:hypothetical protein TSOC_001231 [Tetrabaena socialis]|uniref:Glycosyltransferase family 92 protein n=1 Tax=Tetrabaena socialis TaxID=47790 RepID=A0A2J8AHB2_9CHLO|nr:hypothetical protein TSOC_001231 [Tetrabaena socialis]|eukprot:PNH11881.1 hypothetical protein TSOC_001231 [Tetrabaena socialis]